MAVTHCSISNGSSNDVFRDVGGSGSQFPGRGCNTGGLGLCTTSHLDWRNDQRPKTKKNAERDIETLAQIIRPILNKEAEAEADRLLAKFGTIRCLFQQIGEQKTFPEGHASKAVDYLKVIAASFNYALEQELVSGPVLSASTTLRNYLFHSLSSSKKEMFRVLFLNTNNRLIEDRLMGIGTVNRIQIHVREIIRDALELNATALILVHNHPCGDSNPSASDIALTTKIIDLCRPFELEVIDHLIVAKSGIASLRSLGLIDEKETSHSSKSNASTTIGSLIESCLKSVFKSFGNL